MGLQEKEAQQLLAFKSKLFDFLTATENQGIISIAVQFVFLIKHELEIKDASFYLYNEWEEQFIPIASTIDGFSHKVIPRNQMETILLKSSKNTMVTMKQKEKVVGVLSFALGEEGVSNELIDQISDSCSKIIGLHQQYVKYNNEELRYEQLFGLTAKFHSSMNIDDVLEEVIHTLQNVYPTFSYYLLLSHDNVGNKNLPIKDLEYNNYENSAAIQAYVTGDVQKEDIIKERRSVLYAPLKGKQGVYGVLQVNAPSTVIFPEHEIKFIELLANTAGSALENAQLYQQSKRLVADLQLINDTSHRLNSNLRLFDMIQFMSEQIVKHLNGDEVGFISFHENERMEILEGSTAFFNSEKACDIIEFVNSKIKAERDTLFIGDFEYDQESKGLVEYRSLMAVPMVHSGVLKGVSIVLHQNPYFFSFDTFKLFQSLIHHSTLAFTNSMLREELENLVITDHLTKLHSRNYLDDQIHQSMAIDGHGTFILIDIDNFKCINDTFGHQTGDSVIVQVANLIKANIREGDIGARWGGEELAVYLPKVDHHVGIAIAERLVERVYNSTSPQVTISCGVANWSKDQQDSVQQLFHRADQALYVAKETGKNRVIVQDLIKN